MPLFSTTWTVKDVSVEARQAAVRAASSEGEDLGVWLSRVIRRVGEAELKSNVEATAPEAGNVAAAEDTKLTSIERAMLQPGNGLSRNVGSA